MISFFLPGVKGWSRIIEPEIFNKNINIFFQHYYLEKYIFLK